MNIKYSYSFVSFAYLLGFFSGRPAVFVDAASSSDGCSSDSEGEEAAPPAGCTDFIVQIQNGELDESVPDDDIGAFSPTFCLQGLCLSEYFGRAIQGRDNDEMNALLASANAFFLDRFGFDADMLAKTPTDPTDSVCAGLGLVIPGLPICPKMIFQHFTASTISQNYRAYVISGEEDVPSKGYLVREGGVLAVSLDGIQVGQVSYPPLTSFFLAEYKIVDCEGNTVRDITWRSLVPSALDLNGNRALVNEAKFGTYETNGFADPNTPREGLSELIVVPSTPTTGNLTKANLRNVMTFGGGGLC